MDAASNKIGKYVVGEVFSEVEALDNGTKVGVGDNFCSSISSRFTLEFAVIGWKSGQSSSLSFSSKAW